MTRLLFAPVIHATQTDKLQQSEICHKIKANTGSQLILPSLHPRPPCQPHSPNLIVFSSNAACSPGTGRPGGRCAFSHLRVTGAARRTFAAHTREQEHCNIWKQLKVSWEARLPVDSWRVRKRSHPCSSSHTHTHTHTSAQRVHCLQAAGSNSDWWCNEFKIRSLEKSPSKESPGWDKHSSLPVSVFFFSYYCQLGSFAFCLKALIQILILWKSPNTSQRGHKNTVTRILLGF